MYTFDGKDRKEKGRKEVRFPGLLLSPERVVSMVTENTSFAWDSDDSWTMSYQGLINRLSQEERDLYEIKHAAVEFYRVNRVPEAIERALTELFFQKPGDVHGYLV